MALSAQGRDERMTNSTALVMYEESSAKSGDAEKSCDSAVDTNSLGSCAQFC